MKCTCFKRQYPCEVHGDKHLPQLEQVTCNIFAVNLYWFWPKGSLDEKDKRYGYTVAKDAVQFFDSGPIYKTLEKCVEAAQPRGGE